MILSFTLLQIPFTINVGDSEGIQIFFEHFRDISMLTGTVIIFKNVL